MHRENPCKNLSLKVMERSPKPNHSHRWEHWRLSQEKYIPHQQGNEAVLSVPCHALQDVLDSSILNYAQKFRKLKACDEILGNKVNTINLQSMDTKLQLQVSFYNSAGSPHMTTQLINHQPHHWHKCVSFDGTINLSKYFSDTLVAALQLLRHNSCHW